MYIGPLDGDGRRSIYIKFQLMEAAQFLSAFNLPGGKIAQGRRDASNVPAQSLALLNDPFVLAMADRAYVLVNGRIAYGGPASELAADKALQERLLGVMQAVESPARADAPA